MRRAGKRGGAGTKKGRAEKGLERGRGDDRHRRAAGAEELLEKGGRSGRGGGSV